MFRPLLLALLLAVSLAQPSFGQGNGNGESQGVNGHDQGNTGNGQGSSNGNGSGSNSSGGQGNTGNGQTPAPTGSPPPASGNAPSNDAPANQNVELSQEEASAVVAEGSALSLATIVRSLAERTPGDVVDASLLQVGPTLVYAVKVLSPAGRLSTEYYHADTGRFIGSE